jgi:hypothetical protein
MNPMIEFALHLAANRGDMPEVNPLSPYRHWGAPLGRGVPWQDRHVSEIARRFPKSAYAYHPELSRSAIASWMWNYTMRASRIVPSYVAPAVVVVSAGVVASELQSTLHGNLGMEEIPGSMGGYSHPMGGGDSSYHPFQWFFDLF